jgi:type I restriction enzyme S subunit
MKPQKFKQTEIGMIPENWEVTSLGEIIQGKIRHGIYKDESQFSEKGIKILKMKQQYSTDFVGDQTMERVVVTPEEIKRFGINNGDLVFSRTSMIEGGAGKCSLARGIDGPVIFDGNLLAATLKEKIFPLYVFYYFKSAITKNNILSLNMGTQSRNISSSNLEKVNILLPPLPEQSAIASILSSLDAKIELNNKMNKTLEAIGQAIFKKWFVDEAKEEWKTGFLGDGNLTELIGSGIKKFEGERIYIATADIENANIINYKTNITFKNRPSRANMQLIPNSIWFAKMRESKKIFLIAPYNEFEIKNLIFSTGFAGLKVKPEALYYIWNIINNPSFEIIKDNLSIGTTMQGVNNELIQKITFNIPNKETLEKFNLKTSGIYHKICLNNQESQSLAQIRDALLPKLMSGEIRVPIK